MDYFAWLFYGNVQPLISLWEQLLETHRFRLAFAKFDFFLSFSLTICLLIILMKQFLMSDLEIYRE